MLFLFVSECSTYSSGAIKTLSSTNTTGSPVKNNTHYHPPPILSKPRTPPTRSHSSPQTRHRPLLTRWGILTSERNLNRHSGRLRPRPVHNRFTDFDQLAQSAQTHRVGRISRNLVRPEDVDLLWKTWNDVIGSGEGPVERDFA